MKIEKSHVGSKPTQFWDDSPVQGAENGSTPRQIRHVFRNHAMSTWTICMLPAGLTRHLRGGDKRLCTNASTWYHTWAHDLSAGLVHLLRLQEVSPILGIRLCYPACSVEISQPGGVTAKLGPWAPGCAKWPSCAEFTLLYAMMSSHS